jgi:flavin reductase (DIM6/NTAB) family NADH-FMN oxidoreductase RutF
MAHPAPELDPADVGLLLGGLSAPLAAISTRSGDVSNAQIAVAVTAASIVPQRPRLIVQIYHTNFTHGLIASGGVLAINFLETSQLPLIWELGMHSGRDGDKLEGVSYTTGATGCPLLEGCFGFLDCHVVNAMDGGDMTAFLVEAVAARANGGERMTWREARPRLPRRWADEWDRKIAGEMEISLRTMNDINQSLGNERTQS